jgi:hypothetical protein
MVAAISANNETLRTNAKRYIHTGVLTGLESLIEFSGRCFQFLYPRCLFEGFLSKRHQYFAVYLDGLLSGHQYAVVADSEKTHKEILKLAEQSALILCLNL